jgi:OCT family organic cation transporter-like MFS transporter 4/5
LIYSGILNLLFFFVNPLNEYGPLGRLIIMGLDIMIRLSVSMGNVFLIVYSVELFPTSVRHFVIGFLGFCTKFAFMLTPKFKIFWDNRDIHPNFVIGALILGGYFLVGKLRETKGHIFKDHLEED